MNNKRIAARLKKLRGDISQQKIADKLGIKQSTYAMYETGARRPSDENKRKIAKYHGKTVQEIFFD